MTVPPVDQSRQKDERMWGMLCHLSALSGFVVPFGSIIGPLVIWLVKKNDYPYVDENGKEALNFQISMIIYLFVAALTFFILIGILLVPAVIITNIVLIIIASIKTNEGTAYRYPMNIRFIK